MPKFIIEERCISCGVCYALCPEKAIYEVIQAEYQINPDMCIECGVCQSCCPTDAIEDR